MTCGLKTADAKHLAELEVVRNEDVALEPEARGVSRHAVREIPRRRASEDREPELHSPCGRH